MPNASADSLVRPVVESAVDALWAQWGAVGTVAARSKRPAHAIVDPEALVLGSLALKPYEGRLANQVSWWAHTDTQLLSVQRMKNLAAAYPAEVQKALAGFGRAALEAGDMRWRPMAGRGPVPKARRKDLTATSIRSGDPALLLRLRLAFGVGIKADVIGVLLGMGGSKVPITAIARFVGYYERAVRRAVEDLVAGGLVLAAPTSPASYRVDPASWRSLFQFGDDPPLWRSWHLMFAFVATLAEWANEQSRAGVSAYVLSSRARDLMEEYRPKLAGTLNLPGADGVTGEEYLGVFGTILDDVRDWMRSCV